MKITFMPTICDIHASFKKVHCSALQHDTHLDSTIIIVRWYVCIMHDCSCMYYIMLIITGQINIRV